VPNIDLSPLCSSRFRPGPPSDEAQTLNDRIHKILQSCVASALVSLGFPWCSLPHSADLVPLRSLCIEPGKAVYVLYLDMVCLNYDGNVVDAAVLAANAALRNVRLPAAAWDDDEQAAVELPDEPPRALKLRPPVLSASFGVFGRCAPLTGV